jgi:hypothetical protein
MEMEDAWVRSRSLGLQQQRRAHGQAPGTVESSKVQFGDMIYEAEARARLGGTHTRARTHLRSTLAGFYFLMPRAAAGPRCFCLSYPKSRPPRAGTNHVVGLVAFSGGCPWPPLASPRPRSAAPLPSSTPPPPPPPRERGFLYRGAEFSIALPGAQVQTPKQVRAYLSRARSALGSAIVTKNREDFLGPTLATTSFTAKTICPGSLRILRIRQYLHGRVHADFNCRF